MATEGTLRIKLDARGAAQGAAQYNQASDSIVKDSRRAAKAVDGVDRELDSVEKTGQRVKTALLGVGAGIAAAFSGRAILGSLVEYETGLVGVGKTSDLSGQALQDLGSDILRLSTIIPQSRRDLLDIAQAAGQLGVSGSDNIVKFTATVARLGSASDLAGAEGATSLARLMNITGEAVSEVDRVASVLVKLGNTSAATEREIAFTANQVAAATAAFGTNAQQAAALGAVYASLGVRAELAGSATGRAFRAMDAAIRNQGKELEALAELTGRTEEDISRIFRQDAVAGFQLFVEGLGRIVAKGGDVTATLAEFGLQGEELLKVLPTLAKNSDLVADKVAAAAKEWESNTALTNESAAAAQTLAARWTILGNTMGRVIIERLGESNGVLADLVDTMSGAISFLFQLDTAGERAGTSVQLVATGLQFMATSLALIVGSRFIVWLGRATVAQLGFNAAAKANPIGIMITAIGLVIGGLEALFGHLTRAADATERLKDETVELENAASGLRELRIARERAQEAGDVERAFAKLRGEIELLKDRADELAASDKPLVKFTDLVDLSPDVEGDLGRLIVEDLVNQAQAAGGVNIGDLMKLTDFPKLFEPIEDSFTESIAKAAASADPELAKLVEKFKGQGTAAVRNLQDVWSVPLDALDVSAILESLKLVRVDTDQAMDLVEGRIKKLTPELEKMGEEIRIKFQAEGGDEAESEIVKIRKLQRELSAAYELEAELIGKDADEIELITAKRKAQAESIKRGIADHEWVLKLVEFEITLLQRLRRVQARKEARDDLAAYLKDLAESNRLLRLEIEQGKEAREIEEARLEAAAILGQAKLKLSDEETKAVKTLIQENQNLRAILDQTNEGLEKRAKTLQREADAIPAITGLRERLGLELDLIGKTNLEREILIASRRSSTEAIEREAAAIEILAESILREEKAFEIAKGISDAFGGALDQFLLGTIDAEQALEQFARNVQATLQRELLIEPLTEELTKLLQDLASSFLKALSGSGGGFLSGIFGGSGVWRGAVFQDGKPIPHAAGDLVNFPTFFPLPGGKTGVMGERGTEAVVPVVITNQGPALRDTETGRPVPLKRDDQGRLGVRVTAMDRTDPSRPKAEPLFRTNVAAAAAASGSGPAPVSTTTSATSQDNRNQTFHFHYHGVKGTEDGFRRTRRQLSKRARELSRKV